MLVELTSAVMLASAGTGAGAQFRPEQDHPRVLMVEMRMLPGPPAEPGHQPEPEGFGWMRTAGGFRRTHYSSLDRISLAGYLVAAANAFQPSPFRFVSSAGS